MTMLIYMLEPDEDDQFLTSNIIRQKGFKEELRFFSKSTELFAALKEETVSPSLILINYKSIPDDGATVISTLKSDLRFSYIPLIVLSDATSADIIKDCYRRGANAFISKPQTAEETGRKIEQFFHYWLETVELPGEMRRGVEL